MNMYLRFIFYIYMFFHELQHAYTFSHKLANFMCAFPYRRIRIYFDTSDVVIES